MTKNPSTEALVEAAARSRDIDLYKIRKILSSLNCKYAFQKGPRFTSATSVYVSTKLVANGKLETNGFISYLLREGFNRVDETSPIELSSISRRDTPGLVHNSYVQVKTSPDGSSVSVITVTGLSNLL